MGGFYYTTELGDMWDYIAWQVYGDDSMLNVLMEARENRQYLDTYIFDDNVDIWCPFVEKTNQSDTPDWRDA